MTPKYKKLLLAVAFLFIAILAYVEFTHAPIRLAFSDYYKLRHALTQSQVAFDKQEWGKDSSFIVDVNGFGKRQKMLTDLLEKVLPGMHWKEVDLILGESSTHKDMARDKFLEGADVSGLPNSARRG